MQILDGGMAQVEEQLEVSDVAWVDGFPDALMTTPARELWRHLDGPTLFAIPGRQEPPLFVSVLLHGNEDTGWQAAQSILRAGPLPRTLLLFVGNIAAARAGVRTLPEQEDHNRAWPGTARPKTPLAGLLRKVVARVARLRPFASIDIHNNSGRNPHYACVNRLAEPHLHLATLFGRTVVYFEEPVGVQSAALAPFCPAVTIECGRAGEAASVAHAAELIRAALALTQFPEHPVADGDIDLMRTFATIKVPPAASLSFDGGDADLCLRPDLDTLNFSELEPGTPFGRLGNGSRHRLDVSAAGDDPYFEYATGEIRLTQRAIPAMLSVDPVAVRLDCLGYLMHRIGRDGRRVVP